MPFDTRGVERTVTVKKVRKSVKMKSLGYEKSQKKDQRESTPI